MGDCGTWEIDFTASLVGLNTGSSRIPPPKIGHTHSISNVDGLQDALDDKSNVGHQHTHDDVTDFPVAVDARISSQKAQPGGLTTLDGSGLVPTNQLPSYVDDVLEFANLAAFPGTGESGKIYVALDTLRTYRWSGSVYAEISPSAVKSVNGKTGAVLLDTGDIAERSRLYHTTARVRSAISAIAPIVLNPTTGEISMPAVTASVDGYLKATDWTTFTPRNQCLRNQKCGWIPRIAT